MDGCTCVVSEFPLYFGGGVGYGCAHVEEISTLLLTYTRSGDCGRVDVEGFIPRCLLYVKLNGVDGAELHVGHRSEMARGTERTRWNRRKSFRGGAREHTGLVLTGGEHVGAPPMGRSTRDASAREWNGE